METKIIHITTAHGPAECQLAAAKILATFMKELRNRGVLVDVLNRRVGPENGTLASATLELKGNKLKQELAAWVGTILWIQKSPYRPNHGRKNWYVGIYEVELPKEMEWRDDEFTFQAVRSSGSGGQHVNKVSSAVRAIHEPTGTMVFVQDSRSQFQNKKIAKERILEKLLEQNSRKMVEIAENQWSQHSDLSRGNPIRTFVGMDFKPKKIEKSFKKQRVKLKQDLKNELEL